MNQERQKTQSVEELIVWQKAHAFALGIYKMTKIFPSSELYGLTSQFRRAAMSIAANIAEGYKKRGTKDKIRFLNIAQGSLEESRYYLILARDLNYGMDKKLDLLAQEISKLLEAYINKMKQNTEYRKNNTFYILYSEFYILPHRSPYANQNQPHRYRRSQSRHLYPLLPRSARDDL